MGITMGAEPTASLIRATLGVHTMALDQVAVGLTPTPDEKSH
jgi:hypothetical protein